MAHVMPGARDKSDAWRQRRMANHGTGDAWRPRCVAPTVPGTNGAWHFDARSGQACAVPARQRDRGTGRQTGGGRKGAKEKKGETGLGESETGKEGESEQGKSGRTWERT